MRSEYKLTSEGAVSGIAAAGPGVREEHGQAQPVRFIPPGDTWAEKCERVWRPRQGLERCVAGGWAGAAVGVRRSERQSRVQASPAVRG